MTWNGIGLSSSRLIGTNKHVLSSDNRAFSHCGFRVSIFFGRLSTFKTYELLSKNLTTYCSSFKLKENSTI